MPTVSSNKASLIAKVYPNEVQLIKIPKLNSESSGELGSKSFCFTHMKHQQNKTELEYATKEDSLLYFESTEIYYSQHC